MEKLAPYWKAVVGFVAPGLLVLTSAVTDASAGGVDITAGEWITAIASAFITAAGVYTVRNRPMPEKQDGTHPPALG